MSLRPDRTPVTAVTTAGVAMIGVAYGFARYGSGLFLPQLRAEFGFSVTQAGLISSATYVSYLAALVIVGVTVAHVGPRPLIVAAGLSATTGLVLVATASGLAQLVVGLVLAGASSGLAWAPYSDVVQALVPERSRERVLGVLPSGTAWGVLLAGPLALLTTGPGWRVSWWIFAATAFLVTVWNAFLLRRVTSPRQARTSGRASPRWFLPAAAAPLYLTALSYGVTGAVYWLFAVQAVADATRAGAATPALLWTLIGLSGIAGAFTGNVIERMGLRATHTVLLSVLAGAIALLAMAPEHLVAIAVSGSLYGATFMAISGLLAVWSYQVFPQRPATGFSVTVFFLGIGTIVGPATLGAAAGGHGLPAALLATAVVAALTLPFRPAVRRAPARLGPRTSTRVPSSRHRFEIEM
ncbi:YbfB/YjiJ family MFS transporter [Actinopolymorpha sp. B9G3]|uniref:YbfB/YjiJ family MFS transporter n=1 Tax=Actinopolymorpha sp. B9G3 TaxID=3158970 RepID=UPI0032D98829